MCNNDSACIGDILKVICVLQRNADCGEACLDTCDRGFLGCSVTNLNCNTRPVSLYLCGSNSDPLAMPVSRIPTETETSTVFRVEKCDEGCATFRVLTPNTDPETSATIPFLSTQSFFTVNLSCVCVLRCFNDTFVENI